MTIQHKNKTFTTFLAAVFGGIGIHRFYMAGRKDPIGWLHLATLPVSALLIWTFSNSQPLFMGMLFALSVLCGFLEALVIGLTPDEKWDATRNPASGKKSESHWVLALILVLTLGVGAMSVIALMARSFDLLFTGGAYG
ncbi:membrane protein [Herbaspirillum hiltneri N3]|uniref:Membrane protein n=1 Tax=Herbaspirillum hiltneri N3 TaxID=1262470 RepID=A0ABM5V3I9_9BURK|nr:NINE protein [Herbaspirillum hiltneri]AKZ64162.1 membrane protein [Herbaspirillum hiltneri N3]